MAESPAERVRLVRFARVGSLIGLALGLLATGLLACGSWFGFAFPAGFLAAMLSIVALGTSVLVLFATAVFARSQGPSGWRKWSVLVLPFVASLVAATLAIGGWAGREQLMRLNFRLNLTEREKAARWALAEAQHRELNPYGEPLPSQWRTLSDGGQVCLVSFEGRRGVIFFELRGILEGTGWLYATDARLAPDALEDPEQIAPNWWRGRL